MNQDLSSPKFNASTDEVSEMLGLNINPQTSKSAELPISQSDLPVANLPVATNINTAKKSDLQGAKTVEPLETAQAALDDNKAGKPKYVKILLAILPYAVIFIIGLFLYYFFFSSFNFDSVFKSQSKAQTPKETALQQLEQQDLTSYQTWIKGYYYEVKDSKLTDPDGDNSGNGLSNFQKYLLDLNPKSYDTLGLNMADSQAISEGINPLTGGSLTDSQKTIISKYVDMEAVMNRLALSNLQNQSQGQVAGINIRSNGTTVASNSASVNTLNNFYPSVVTSDNLDIDTSVPGLLEIPDLKISVPVIWSQSTKNFTQDLQVGIIHYPGTAMPGQVGTTYIAGHSSNYVWAKGDYNQIFSHLGDLGNNASFKITVTQKNGKKAIIHYIVVSRQQYSPIDQSQFTNTGKSLVALSTCWPVGSTSKRLVVFGQLAQVEK